ncbi:MAG: zf-HC2 domain-containing protein [Candidatus Zixiibacteriota bacterium]|nr:MAG: zf-HC2 domain-containing protein [candidate division Zixibacteria bacterium]
MNCEKYKDRLPLYVLGEVQGDDLGTLEEHIRICSSCGLAVEELKSLISSLADSSDDDLTESEKLRLENNVYRALVRRSSSERTSQPKIISRLAPVVVRVAAVLVIFLFGYVSRSLVPVAEQSTATMAESVGSQVELAKYHRAVASQLRFSPDGLKAIAKGKSVLLTDLTREP